MKHISLDEFWNLLRTDLNADNYFDTIIPNRHLLTPENLLAVARTHKKRIDRQTIPGWSFIEQGKADLPLADILKQLVEHTIPARMYLLTDDSFFTDQVVELTVDDKLDNLELSDFFSLDALDHIAYGEHGQQLVIIHHEGVTFSVSFTDRNFSN